ncbi:phosphoribosylformylglycinamidine cyclo-ligase [Helicovermis profundi]|uniref:Phosphoribosylformylglycinamidine cyclo-ligase n=1 Tax=Helicovermis profundi TaxID=3065157 RepID=A0AAU9E710_9FIRM|nr:phosphoribosylformylglycinamidine cyclo-ligase [Clostridia bacterium S502]
MSANRDEYKKAGVNVEEGYKAVTLMKDHVKKTFNNNVLMGLGSFGGMFDLSFIHEEGIKKPVLISGTDGVGTKLKVAFELDKHDTVGIDLVAMCVNDILCHGAKPLFFLDYIATGKLEAEKAESIVKGVTDGCLMSGLALIGGETAEMPGFYSENEYDLAGFTVGIVDKDKIVNGANIDAGDVIIGLPSSGVHSNGFSLVRKILNDNNIDFNTKFKNTDKTFGQVLLEPTRIYYKEVKTLLDKVNVKGMVHITGGGFYENIPRVLPKGMGAKIDKNSWNKPEIFDELKRLNNIDDNNMYATFNMGIGYMVIVSKGESLKAIEALKNENLLGYIIGEVVSEEGVSL